MKYWNLLLVILLSSFGYKHKPKEISKPKLVVGIVIDQMRYDYLLKFKPHFSQNGFAKLMGGTNCHQTYVNHIPTFTAPGHASIYTGSVPGLNGIVGNDWIERLTDKEMYCTQDDNVETVGSTSKAGKMSPKNLWSTTITDELKLAYGQNAKVFGISIKDRGAILPAGHAADGAYWFDSETGNWISSTFYTQALPDWLQKFNANNYTDSFLRLNWTLLLNESNYKSTLPDSNDYENLLKNEKAPVFPHDLAQFAGQNKGAIRNSPWGNTFTFQIAKELIEHEKLGMHDLDFLALSLSSTDYIGHFYAPESREIEDCYIRLDRDLAEFISYLEAKLGKENILIFLTADHGGAHNAQYIQDNKINGGFIYEKDEKDLLNKLIENQYGLKNAIHSVENYQIYFNSQIVTDLDVKAKLTDFLVQHLKQDSKFQYVLDYNHPENWIIPQVLKNKIMNGFSHSRCGDLLVIPKPQYYASYNNKGTTHGTWNPYDSRIPLLWYGGHIKRQNLYNTYYMSDIAPTLALLLGLQVPNGCIGTPILELIN